MKLEYLADRVRWQLDGSVRGWVDSLPLPAAAAIAETLVDDPPAWDRQTLEVPAEIVATWPASATSALGLPANSPLNLDLKLSGAMGKLGASIKVRWLRPGMSLEAKGIEQRGLWLDWNDRTWRISDPMFTVLRLVDEFNQCTSGSLDEQFRSWATIRAALGDSGAEQLTDGFLRGLRIISASSLTFTIGADARGEVQLEPALLTEAPPDGNGQPVYQRALPESEDALFVQRLDQLREGAPAFPLRQGTYIVVDEPLRKTLAAVRTLRAAPAEQRKRAARHPEAVIRETLGVANEEPIVFVETECFAERVLDVGEWRPPVIPWIKIPKQDWNAPVEAGARKAGIRIDGVDVPLDLETLGKVVQDFQAAVDSGQPKVCIDDQMVAATPSNLELLKQLQKAVQRGVRGPDERDDEDASQAIKNVLIIETNFEEASFSRTAVGKRPGQLNMPLGLRTTPKKHQETGIEWLQRHWIEGSRGGLLCDDMGLGKTYQALAFCVWLRELMQSGALPTGPLLLVAPVGLLRNWEMEIDDHLHAPGLGTLVRAYGEHLKILKRGRHIDGTAGLDTARLGAADVVLANYEAVSDYQMSFGAIRFAAVVLDEAQKIKTPSARMTHAVKALNTDFMIAMTGTPVENRLADLWCIADAVQPGALADLKDFSTRYESADADVHALRSRIWQEESEVSQDTPKLLMRRLKTEKLDGLPEKHEHTIQIPMPPAQLEAYRRALAMKEVSGPSGMLGMIHALRRVSLHPSLLTGIENEPDFRFEDSARFIGMIEALDRIAKAGERALVFLESLDLQDVGQLPLLLQRRYGLATPPMVINGTVSTEARQARVKAFQEGTGFDLMLLSPKAGGVGLTLTSANHVIHLSRWWNPAVEDQCSDRAYRIGQTKPVHVYYPLAVLPEAPESSFDMQLQILMSRKRQLAGNLLAPPAFNQQDYRDLLAGAKVDL